MDVLDLPSESVEIAYPHTQERLYFFPFFFLNSVFCIYLLEVKEIECFNIGQLKFGKQVLQM